MASGLVGMGGLLSSVALSMREFASVFITPVTLCLRLFQFVVAHC